MLKLETRSHIVRENVQSGLVDNSAQVIWNYPNKKEACGVESPKYILAVLTVCDACCKMLHDIKICCMTKRCTVQWTNE